MSEIYKHDYSQRLTAGIIYDFICRNTSENRPLSRREIADKLAENYGLVVGRRALSRHLNTMYISEIGIVITDKNKIYYDKNEDYSLNSSARRKKAV